MAQITPVNALPWPELGDIPNAQTAFQNLANQLDTRLVPRFANDAARTAAITAPEAGMLSFQQDSGRFEYYTGALWLPVQKYTARQTISTAPAVGPSVTFSGIPTNLRRLTLRWQARVDAGIENQNMYLRINGDSGSNYNSQELDATNTTPAATNLPGSNVGLIGSVIGASAGAGQWASGVVEFQGWDTSDARLCWTFVTQALANTASFFTVLTGGGQYLPAGPYTSITLQTVTGNFIIGSDFQLEGEWS